MKRYIWLIVVICCCAVPGLSSFAGDLPNGFVYIEDVIPNIQLEMRYYTEDNFVGKRIDGYEKPRSIISKEAADALKKVQNDLRSYGLGLKIYDAYRPQSAVDHFVRWANDFSDKTMKSKYYPDVDKKNLFKEGYIAKQSGHSRGSSVDLTIVSLDTDVPKELDMGTRWDFFDPKSWPNNRTVAPSQRAHRMLLQNLMSRHEFMPIKEEWWHFTLKNEPFPEQYFNFSIK